MKKPKITKEQFLKRCATAWDAGYVDLWGLKRARNSLDLVMRLKAAYVGFNRDSSGNDLIAEIGVEGHQGEMAISSLVNEIEIAPKKKLACDTEAYQAIQFVSLLTHPCQKCAEDKDAWHTRAGFCPHRGED